MLDPVATACRSWLPQWSPALTAGVSGFPLVDQVGDAVAAMESGLDGRSQWVLTGLAVAAWVAPQWSPALTAGVSC